MQLGVNTVTHTDKHILMLTMREWLKKQLILSARASKPIKLIDQLLRLLYLSFLCTICCFIVNITHYYNFLMCSFSHVHALSVSHSDTDLLTVVVFQSEKVQLQINYFDLQKIRRSYDKRSRNLSLIPCEWDKFKTYATCKSLFIVFFFFLL